MLRVGSIIKYLNEFGLLVVIAILVCFMAVPVGAVTEADDSSKVTVITFERRMVKSVRFRVLTNYSWPIPALPWPCIEEMEVYGPGSERNLAMAENGVRVRAYSSREGYPAENITDGKYGMANSWIPATSKGAEVIQLDFLRPVEISKIIVRALRGLEPMNWRVRVASDGYDWQRVYRIEQGLVPFIPPAPGQTEGTREICSGCEGAYEKQLCEAFLGEEYAWLRAFSRAEISGRLMYYETRTRHWLNHERHCPAHPARDRIPVPVLSSEPEMDGRLDDACWGEASRGVVRVAYPEDFGRSPLVEYGLLAGRRGENLYLAVRTERLLSSHVAVVSSADGRGRGVVAWTKEGLVFRRWQRGGDGHVDDSFMMERSVAGGVDEGLCQFEFCLPLWLFPYCEERGLEVGLGMGGRHVRSVGRPVQLVFSGFSLAEQLPQKGRSFRVRLAVPSGSDGVRLRGNVGELKEGLRLGAGRSRMLEVGGERGPLGPEYELKIEDEEGRSYVLNLFRHDPLERQLTLLEGLVERLGDKGVDVQAAREAAGRFRMMQEGFLSAERCDSAAERRAVLEVRRLRRDLFWRDPDLAAVEKVLFVKRRPFEPTHNYSVHFDAEFRLGGGICLLDVPRESGRFEPAKAKVTRLYEAGDGIARTPMANFDVSKIYFGYRPTEDGYYHIMKMNSDGSELKQITEGPFHDYWPCPLPDGGLAFISTRCKARYLCWRPQAAVLFRMNTDGGDILPISFANLTEWAPSVMRDGRIIWTRSEYQDKGANFGHTLWAIRPDGTKPELVFGNDIIQPAGYANGREVPGTNEIVCTLISHFGDLNGPLALVDVGKGRFAPKSIHTLTPEIPWPGQWPISECFRDPVPLCKDYFLCSHAPWGRFGLYVVDRFGNRELLYEDREISSVCPTVFRRTAEPAVVNGVVDLEKEDGEFIVRDVYRGISPTVKPGTVRYIRVVQELRSNLERLANGEYRKDHPNYGDWYATPVHKVSGFYRWPTYVAKAPLGIVPVEEDGSAHFYAPAGKVLYFQVLDEDFNELQRMRSVVQLQPGEKRSCVGCHESRQGTAANSTRLLARGPRRLEPPPWGAGPFSFEKVVQPVLDAKCVRCHDGNHKLGLDFRGTLDRYKVPVSYRTLVERELVDYVNCGFDWGGCEKLEPLAFGTVKSRLWKVLDAGHHDVKLTGEEARRSKTWIDLNCPLWPDYTERSRRPVLAKRVVDAD